MAGYFDVYVLSQDRSKETVLGFLSNFLPDREESQDDYGLPHLSERPQKTFAAQNDLLDYLESHPNQPHAIYWHSVVAGDPRGAMIFPLSDGHMIYGLSVELQARRFLSEAITFLKARMGYITFESPPPTTAEAFKKEVEAFDSQTLRADRTD